MKEAVSVDERRRKEKTNEKVSYREFNFNWSKLVISGRAFVSCVAGIIHSHARLGGS